MTNREAIEYASKNSFVELYRKGVIDGVKLYNKRIWNEVDAPLSCAQLRQIDSIAKDIEREASGNGQAGTD